MVVDRDRECALGGVLANDVILEEIPDFGGLGQFVEFYLVPVGQFLFDNLVAQVDALVTDVNARASRSPPSPIRAMVGVPYFLRRRYRRFLVQPVSGHFDATRWLGNDATDKGE